METSIILALGCHQCVQYFSGSQFRPNHTLSYCCRRVNRTCGMSHPTCSSRCFGVCETVPCPPSHTPSDFLRQVVVQDQTAAALFAPASRHGKPPDVTTAGARRGGNLLSPSAERKVVFSAPRQTKAAFRPPFYLRSLALVLDAQRFRLRRISPFQMFDQCAVLCRCFRSFI